MITNLRMFFDCKIVLGGYVGGYLDEFMPDLAKKVMEYNKFDLDTSYLSTGKYKLEAAASMLLWSTDKGGFRSRLLK